MLHPFAPSPDSRLIELTHLREEISYALQHRGERLLEAQDPAVELQQLAPLQAFFVFKELGLHAAGPLLRHATAEQLQACVDLDCWPQEALACEELDAWLGAAAAESGEALAETFLALDEEVQILFLRRVLLVHALHTDSDPTVPDAMLEQGYFNTPDGLFTLTLCQPEAELDPVEIESAQELLPTTSDDFDIEPFVLVEALYRHDPDDARRLLLAAKWELDAEVEERALQFRAARLGDMGFSSRLESLQIFAPPPAAPPARLLQPGEGARLPAPYAAALRSGGLLVAAWNGMAGRRDSTRLEAELITLINALLLTGGGGARDMQGVLRRATEVEATLSLGLLALQQVDAEARADVARASRDLAAWPLQDIFRHGFAASAALRAQADAWEQSTAGGSFLAQASERDDAVGMDQAFLRGLLQRPPCWSERTPTGPTAPQALREPAQVAMAAARLQALIAST